MRIHSCARCWARRKPNPRLECQGPSAWRGFMQIEDGKFIQITRLQWPALLSQQRTQALPHPGVTSCMSPRAPAGPEGKVQGQIPWEALPASHSLFQVPACPLPVLHGKLLSANRPTFCVCFSGGQLRVSGDGLTVSPGSDNRFQAQIPGGDAGLRALGPGISLAVQWLRNCAANAGGVGSIPAWGTKNPHVTWCSQKILKKKSPGA